MEYQSEAIVLDKEPSGEMDMRYAFFTKKFGKVVARAKSARKITSKLSPHLEPGSFARVRIVEKNGFQVVDTLREKYIFSNPLKLRLLNKILHDFEPDLGIWSEIESGTFRWPEILKFLGWDPGEASCSGCGAKPEIFSVAAQDFSCGRCLSCPVPRIAEGARHELAEWLSQGGDGLIYIYAR